MNERQPEPGSPWARHCPDAWPREWLDSSGTLPPGFTRPAEPLEADLITGRISEAAFQAQCGMRSVCAPTPRPDPKRKPNLVVRKLLGYRRFLDALPDLDRRLSPGAVALWCWLWTCEGKGHAHCSVRRLAERFRVSNSTATRWFAELRTAGFLRVVQRGRTGRSATVVQVRAGVPPAKR
jgi:hypothetical protein